MRLHFAHIVNPYSTANGELDSIQRLTLTMMRRAAASTKHEVKLLTAQFSSDRHLIPDGFSPTYDLDRALPEVLHQQKSIPRLPLLADILERAVENTDAEYIIYSNMDIVPVPEFYGGVAALIEKNKCDALIINRRRVDPSLVSDPDLFIAETGEPHPGYDCFIFHRSLLSSLTLGQVCVGSPGIGFMFAHNLFLFANKCVVSANKHLTLHAGFEIVQKWKGKEAMAFQMKEIRKFINANKNYFSIEKFPGYNFPFFKRHFRWLMNPLFHYPMMFRLDMKKLFDGRSIIHPVKKDSWWQEWKSSRINFD